MAETMMRARRGDLKLSSRVSVAVSARCAGI